MIEVVLMSISAIAAAISAILSAVAINRNRKLQESIKTDNKNKLTIDAINQLQTEVLDKLAIINKKDVIFAVEEKDNPEVKKVYDNFRTFLARLEHFSIAVNENVYDFILVDKFIGVHLIYLYKKLEPITDTANKYSKDKDYYSQYKKLVKRLNENHSE